MSATVVVPFHRNLEHLQACLAAIRASLPDAEVIVSADGATEACHAVVSAQNASLVEVPDGPAGPAAARNLASEQASGEFLLFVDADVVVSPEALPGMCALLASTPSLAGVFGAYDHTPSATNLVSQFKNLAHAYVHEHGRSEAATFWAGLGAVRAPAYRIVGGFDERFRRPSVEDIDLGQRMVAAGFALRLDPSFRCTHLKRWTLRNCVATDLFARGIPWVQLIRRRGGLPNDLNTTLSLRLSVAVSYALVGALVFAIARPRTLLAVVPLTAVLIGLNYDFYRWCATLRGWGFAARVVPLHLVHHLSNGLSYVIGTTLHLAGRAGLALPGTLPRGPWPAAATGIPAPSRPS